MSHTSQSQTNGPAGPPQAGDGVTVRMYDVGFGDAFLLLIPTPGGRKKVLIDCGSVKADRLSIDEVVERIVEDVRDADGVPRIDVVVATHRHRDHVSGFARPAWAEVRVKEVWMPWTEHPTDPVAARIREAQTRLALRLSDDLDRPGADASLRSLALNALSNEEAMATLHTGFAREPKPCRRFLPGMPPDDRSFEVDALPGVVVHVLGPSREEAIIREMDPPAGQSYLAYRGAFAHAIDGEPPGAPRPFEIGWSLSPQELALDPIYSHLTVNATDRAEMQLVGAGMEEAAAVALDAAVNGTSLMLMLQVGGAHLLFPGDAQWGTWRAALADAKWRRLLERTTFYKVGHHGSHNATPIEFVEEVLARPVRCMASVKPVARWPSIPRKPLLRALAAGKHAVVRSDEADRADARFFRVEPGVYVETDVLV